MSDTDRTMNRIINRTGPLEASAWALLLLQIVHGATPAGTHSEGHVGTVGGLALVLAAAVAVVGFRTGRTWARALTGWTGLTVAVGFLLYHAVPFTSPLTNPYLGHPAGAAAWISVGFAVAAGAWAAFEAFGRRLD